MSSKTMVERLAKAKRELEEAQREADREEVERVHKENEKKEQEEHKKHDEEVARAKKEAEEVKREKQEKEAAAAHITKFVAKVRQEFPEGQSIGVGDSDSGLDSEVQGVRMECKVSDSGFVLNMTDLLDRLKHL